jgi:hypothetical protein
MPAPEKSAHQRLRQTGGGGEPITATERNLAAWDRWEGSAKRFRGLNIRLQAKQELKHITLTEGGYQVRLYRGGKGVFSRSVRGRSEESLREAMRVRDEVVRDMPGQRINQIPPRVLRALGLARPVPGICRLASRSVYRIFYFDAAGRRRTEQFYYRVVPEVDAYAAAIAFMQAGYK